MYLNMQLAFNYFSILIFFRSKLDLRFEFTFHSLCVAPCRPVTKEPFSGLQMVQRPFPSLHGIRHSYSQKRSSKLLTGIHEILIQLLFFSFWRLFGHYPALKQSKGRSQVSMVLGIHKVKRDHQILLIFFGPFGGLFLACDGLFGRQMVQRPFTSLHGTVHSYRY